MNGIFKGLGSTFAKVVSQPNKRDFMVIGLGTGFFFMGIMTWSGLSEETLKNDSVYARRYFGKYRQYNLEQHGDKHH